MQPLRSTKTLNEQDSAQSIAVRYGLLYDMAQTGFDLALYRQVQRLCSSVRGCRLGLTADATEKLASDCAAEINWVKERFGLDMSEPYQQADVEIASLPELRAHGHAIQSDLGDYLHDTWGTRSEFNGNWISYFRNVVQKLQDAAGNLISVPADFNALDYLAANPDVAAAGVDPAQHFRIHGFKEGRPLR